MNKFVNARDLAPGQYSVVRVIARLNVGGPAQHVLHLTRELADSYATLLITGAAEADEIEISYFGPDVHILRVKELGRSVRAIQDFVAFVKVWRILRKVRPQIVHTHTAKAGTIGRLAAFFAGVPIRVHTFHGHVFEGYFSALTSRAVIWFERALAQITTRIIAISDSQARDLSERFAICRPGKIKVIPLGLDLAPFYNIAKTNHSFRREVNAEGALLVVAIGRLAPVKNHGLLVEAAARLKDLDIRFAIVGGGGEAASLRAHAARLGVSDRVVFVGWRHDLATIYAASDLVVLTSVNEGTPVCLIEALAANVPVIASDVGGVADLLGQGSRGVLFPSGDAEALAQAIRTVYSSYPAREKRRVSSEYVMEMYSVKRLVRDIELLYSDLTKPAGQRTSQELPHPSYQT